MKSIKVDHQKQFIDRSPLAAPRGYHGLNPNHPLNGARDESRRSSRVRDVATVLAELALTTNRVGVRRE